MLGKLVFASLCCAAAASTSNASSNASLFHPPAARKLQDGLVIIDVDGTTTVAYAGVATVPPHPISCTCVPRPCATPVSASESCALR